MNIEIIKCHGSNNDFVLIDELFQTYHFSESDRVSIATTLCDRDGLIGADGILFTMPSNHADARMRMFNPDGSEAEMCGNGLRCVGRYVCEKLDRNEIMVETNEADLSVVKKGEIYDDVPAYEVSIEPVRLDPQLFMKTEKKLHVELPIETLSEDLTFTAVSVPNPHLITMVPEIHDENLSSIGKQANEDKNLLPSGVNVSFIQPLGDQKIFVRTYERGVGLTNACGTAMSASSLTTVLLEINQLSKEIYVYNRGGYVICVVEKQGDEYVIKLRGNATYEYKTTLDIDLENKTCKEQSDRVWFEQEKEAYAKLQEHAKEEINLAAHE
ncbi:diaminopimelate epimerase [Pontibacillus yanchengensis]|uniref:Diaminopimelate epimerase n=1 Tax=Pontibacillus yanchengensis Y32 TaxID=1385514 RepID=A0A0A2TU72_9BACI|nr:diaminopimelate epimerase [Pontibacillus yanchengensis]KGP72795.1 diaminopimelate epimerase [Pontibacillus yanchengensis Y32]